jgi:hypothetical protein
VNTPGIGPGLQTICDVRAVDFPARARDVMHREVVNPMRNDTTALERKVLAHEQILQVLIGHLAETDPKFLDRLKAVFTRHHNLGVNEQDYFDTAQYAEQFIREIEKMQEYKATR